MVRENADANPGARIALNLKSLSRFYESSGGSDDTQRFFFHSS
jgi:hypothetical protein